VTEPLNASSSGPPLAEEVPSGRRVGLRRELGLLGLVAAAVCTVIGGGINVLSVEVQDKVPGVGGWVPMAFVIGVTPALFTALAYAILASAMPRAGGGYIYASRALHPLPGFLATWSKWFGLSSCIGVIAYIDVSLLRDAGRMWGLQGVAQVLDTSVGTLWIPLLMVWGFWLINILGMRTFGATVIALMFFMLLGGVCIIVTGFVHNQSDFARAVAGQTPAVDVDTIVRDTALRISGEEEGSTLSKLILTTPFLFFAYIGFATISQAGGEARAATRSLPRAFVIATIIITSYYVLYSAAVYHAVPWQYIAHEVATSETRVTAPFLIGHLMPWWLAGFVALTAGVALANDIPPMLMAVSRLFFSWAKDGIFPRRLAAVNARFGTPHWALTLCALVATGVIIECHLHPDTGFFTGVELVNMALLFTYMLIGLSAITFPYRNPELYRGVAFIRNRNAQVVIGLICILSIGALLGTQIQIDVKAAAERYSTLVQETTALKALGVSLYRSGTAIWVLMLAVGAAVFAVMWNARRARGEDLAPVFKTLPEDVAEEGPPPEILE
jgi:APA family basic amino acid/polyamine antiporter